MEDAMHEPAPSLEPTRRRDLPDLARLWSHPDVMRWVGFPEGMEFTTRELRDWWDAMVRDERSHHFIVVEHAAFCGEAHYRLDDPPTTAGLDIKLLPFAQGRGVATVALTMLMERIAEQHPSVTAVWVEPSPENVPARRLYERLRFRPAPRPAHLPSGDHYWQRSLEDIRRRAARRRPRR